MGFKRIAEKVVTELNEKGVPSYIWHVAKTGSVYVRFEDNRIGSIRFGDHDGRAKLKYKYNVRNDKKGIHFGKWEKDGTQWRYYVSSSNWQKLVDVLILRAEEVKKWEKSKYSYTIPNYKKNQSK